MQSADRPASSEIRRLSVSKKAIKCEASNPQRSRRCSQARFLMNGAQALDNTVKPEFTDRLEKVPEVALLIGNSYSFYNCGVHTYLRGMMRASTPKLGMKTRLLTISSGSLSFHDIDFYLKPHEQDPYADVNDKGELKHRCSTSFCCRRIRLAQRPPSAFRSLKSTLSLRPMPSAKPGAPRSSS